MRAFVLSRFGYNRPKQYCAFVGRRSLFQHTVDRADALGSPERRVVVAATQHREYLDEQLRGRDGGKLILQPRNRGTAVGIFAGLTHVLARDPDATVVIYPSDHFVYPETTFLSRVHTAVGIAREFPQSPVLLGVRPGDLETDYGWIVPSPRDPNGLARRVATFIEKPPPSLAEKALRLGGLWNTMIVASQLGTLWKLGSRLLPEIMPALARCRDALGAGNEQSVLEEVYRDLPSRDFSYDVLQRARRELSVLELSGVWWSDWGRPNRILETIGALEKKPTPIPSPGCGDIELAIALDFQALRGAADGRASGK
jgi:mannose-1-phosphate guanylyltransferase